MRVIASRTMVALRVELRVVSEMLKLASAAFVDAVVIAERIDALRRRRRRAPAACRARIAFACRVDTRDAIARRRARHEDGEAVVRADAVAARGDRCRSSARRDVIGARPVAPARVHRVGRRRPRRLRRSLRASASAVAIGDERGDDRGRARRLRRRRAPTSATRAGARATGCRSSPRGTRRLPSRAGGTRATSRRRRS